MGIISNVDLNFNNESTFNYTDQLKRRKIMKRELFGGLALLSILGTCSPSWAAPVLWNYTKRPATFTVCQYSKYRNNRGCGTVTYSPGGYGDLHCDSTCTVSIPKTGKIPAQKVYYTDGQRVTLDNYGLQVNDD